LAAGLLRGPAAGAQVPALLAGQWQVQQISFTTTQGASPELLARMDNPEVAELNQEIVGGAAQLRVEFRPDGTYLFTVARAGEPPWAEDGTYHVAGQVLLAQSPASAGGSSFDKQQLTQLSRRRLVLVFPVGPELPGVLEEVAYRRVR